MGIRVTDDMITPEKKLMVRNQMVSLSQNGRRPDAITLGEAFVRKNGPTCCKELMGTLATLRLHEQRAKTRRKK